MKDTRISIVGIIIGIGFLLTGGFTLVMCCPAQLRQVLTVVLPVVLITTGSLLLVTPSARRNRRRS